jgi:hypothetical protein
MRLARGDFVDSLRQVEIRNSPELTSLDRYFGSKRVGSLRFLVVNSTGLSDAATLIENPACASLESLSLARCELGTDTVDELGTSRHLKKLRKLNLSYNRDDEVVGAIHKLLRSRALRSLESLALCGCDMEGFDWVRVDLPGLRRLDLRDNALDLDEIEEILQAGGLHGLRELVVNTPEGALPTRLDRRIVLDDRKPAWA